MSSRLGLGKALKYWLVVALNKQLVFVRQMGRHIGSYHIPPK